MKATKSTAKKSAYRSLDSGRTHRREVEDDLMSSHAPMKRRDARDAVDGLLHRDELLRDGSTRLTSRTHLTERTE